MNTKQAKLRMIIIASMLFVGASLLLMTGSHAGSSDFEIKSYTSYSNALGDRSCTIRVKNIKSGGRIIDSTDFVAILADGATVRGKRGNNIRIDSGKTGSIMVEFGRHKWPVDNVKLN